MPPSNLIVDQDHSATQTSILFQLPDKVVLNVLHFLDTPSILALRETCKGTKSWIETSPGFLHALKIYIKDEAQMKEVIDSSEVEWENVIIPPHLCNAKCIPFLQRFKTSITLIKIQRKKTEKETFGTDGLNKFLASTSPGLKLLDVADDLELWFLAGMLQFLGQ